MTKEELNFAIRKALGVLDEWNDCTGAIPESYYSEVIGVVEDAVKIGVKVALYGLKANLKELDKSDEATA